MKRNESISLADQRMQSRSIDELYDSESKERLSSHEFGLDGSNLRTESTVSPRRNLSQDPTADVSEGINKEGYVYSQKYKAMNTFEKAGYEIMTYFESFLASDSYMKDKKQRIHQAMLQVQTEEHKLEEKGNLFLAVMQGDIDAIKEYLLNLPPKEQINCVDKRDSVGGNIIHAAYLYEKYDIGQWLIVTYPEVGIKPFSRELTTEATDKVAKVCGMIPNSHDMLYSGENILHMAIVRKNLAETRWILDFYRWHKDSVEGGLEKLLLGNADGNFFEKDGEFYCGCYPLHFAACTNVTELFDLVLSYVSSFGGDSEAPKESTSNDDKKHLDVGANAIFMRDRYGNNCLHLCVLKNLKEMYVHIKSRSQKIIRKEITLKYIHVLDEYFKDGKYDEITAKGRVPIELNKLPETDGFDMGYLPKEILLESAPSDAKTKAYQDWLAKLTEKKVQERLDLVLNCDYHSPITLCASQFTNPQAKDYKVKEDRKREMLEFLLHEMKIVLWTYGSVRTSLISMEGIEFAYYPEGYNNLPASVAKEMFGVVEWLCITKSNACAKIPEVQKIISAKWHLYGLKIFLQQFYFRFFLTLLLFIVLLLANSTPFKNTVGSPDAAYLAAFLYPFILILISITSIYNLPLLWEYGFDYWGLRTGFSYRHVRGAAKYEKLMDTFLVLSYVSVFVNVFLRFNSQNDDTYGDIGTKISLTVCILVAWMYLFYFFMGFESTGPFVLTIYRIVSSDIPYFVMFYFLVIVAFGCSLSLLTNNGDPTIGYNVGHVLYTMYDLIQVTVSLQQNGNFHDELNSTFVPEQLVTIFSFLLTIFYFIVVLMFLNLLIAMINNTYSLYKEFDDATFLIEKYNIMSVIQKKQALIKGNARHIPNSYCLLDINDNKSTELAKPKPTPMFHLHRKSMDAKTVSEDDITQESALERPRYLFEMIDPVETWGDKKEKVDEAAKPKVTLFLIMPQNDFHEKYGNEGDPDFRSAGSLAVTGSNEDATRIKNMIDKNIEDISHIIVALDTHHLSHIAHAVFWVAGENNPALKERMTTDPSLNKEDEMEKIHPAVFTIIDYEDIENEIWMPYHLDMLPWVKYYTKELRRKNKQKLCIWPEHCLIGSEGHAIVKPINDAIQRWATRRNRQVKYVLKGENLRTEMFSVLKAEVVDDHDPTTSMDWELMADLQIADKVYICGQALSHCVRYTMEDILRHWDTEFHKIHLLTDGCSSVAGHEDQCKEFIANLQEKGVILSTCGDPKMTSLASPSMQHTLVADKIGRPKIARFDSNGVNSKVDGDTLISN